LVGLFVCLFVCKTFAQQAARKITHFIYVLAIQSSYRLDKIHTL